MRNLLGLVIATFCLMWMPTQAQAQAQVTKQGKAAKASRAAQAPKVGKIFRDCPTCPEMVVIHSGSFDMGSPDSETEKGRGDDESPVHRVKVAAFALGKTEITRGQFAAFAKATKYSTDDKCWTLEKGTFEDRSANWDKPGYAQGDKHPVACINWNDAKAYAKWMSRKTGKRYRLPTEAEWEYAARGKTSTSRYWGDNPDEACEYANVADEKAQAQIDGATSWWVHKCMDGFAYTAPVGSFKANAFGLKDMLGNVWEWTEDSYHDSYEGAPTGGSARQGDGAKRTLRGGSWNNSPQHVRAGVRHSNKPTRRFSIFGFRLARMLP
ncbi:MAG: formylglycine-generating enzyme family protein [Gallionella sp.]|nr:formylglycine-generating enzyme family protein [Gallionella sp.]